jgi:hypothetical protein
MLDKDQLEALRRQVEEDYQLDLAAIERLYRRFIPGSMRPAVASVTPIETRAPIETRVPIETRAPIETRIAMESRGAAVPKISAHDEPQPQQDELTGSLRAMFSSIHK